MSKQDTNFTHADLNQNLQTSPGSFVLIDRKDVNDEKIERKAKTFWQDAWLQLKANKAAIVGLIGLVLLVIMAFVGPMISGHTYRAQNIDHANLPPKIEDYLQILLLLRVFIDYFYPLFFFFYKKTLTIFKLLYGQVTK